MFTGRVRDGSTIRFLSRVLLLFVILGPVQALSAQQAASISPSVVLVLKLVSKTLVKPTTGIVVSDQGIVAVPAEFAAEEGEMIVLDGGADILSNGRPASLMETSAAGKLAFLTVKGLKRPGIKLSANALEADAALHMEAFPPAENIAKGEQPLELPVKVLRDGQSGRILISAETPLPYVTGAILDACGNLAGISLASGPQSLDTLKSAATLFGDELGRSLNAIEPGLTAAVCNRSVATSQESVPAAKPAGQAVIEVQPQETQAEANKDTLAETAEPAAPESGTPVIPAPEEAVAQQDQESAPIASERPSIWRSVPAWLAVPGLFILGLMIWKGVFFFRLGNRVQEQVATADPANRIQAASEEPVTAPLANAEDDGLAKPRSAPVAGLEIPSAGTRPDDCDGLLLVEGFFDTGDAFKRFSFVDTGNIDLVIGRGDADIAIEHEAISRRHARIVSDGGRLTLSDLGSRNGSFIGDLPCLPGEIFYLEDEDEIFMGDVRMTIRAVRQVAEWA